MFNFENKNLQKANEGVRDSRRDAEQDKMFEKPNAAPHCHGAAEA